MGIGYMTSAVAGTHLDKLASTYPTLCTRSTAADWGPSQGGGNCGYVKIAAAVPGSPAQRSQVLILGGVHAHELAPPDALISFLEKLLPAYVAKKDLVYPAWTDPVSGIPYGKFIIPWTWIQPIVERLDLYVAPMVNPEGRDFVVKNLKTLPPNATLAMADVYARWRKNRRPAAGGGTGPTDPSIGVDVNRNFDIAWDFTTLYDVAVADVHTSTNPVNELYAGPAKESEPETRNVANLMRSKQIEFFMDVHAFSRDILYSWGIEANQNTDGTQNFANPAWNGKRDGVTHNAYGEFIPIDVETALAHLTKFMSDQIRAMAGGPDLRAQARSIYTAKPSAAGLYVTTGASDDYCFSRWFTSAAAGTPTSPVVALTMEAGADSTQGLGADYDDGGWLPDHVKQYPKIEREIHVAVWSFLTRLAGAGYQQPAAPLVPAPPPAVPVGPPAKSGDGCPSIAAYFSDPLHPDVMFLRDLRDRQLRVGRFGNRFADVLSAFYTRISPTTAKLLGQHRTLRFAVRAGFLRPLVVMLRLTSAATRRGPRVRPAALAAVLVLGLLLGAAAALTGAVGGAAALAAAAITGRI
jgi:murein tripeptide amidase MpaA